MRSSPLRLLLRPAVLMMNRLRYGPKFIVIGLFLLAPVGMVSLLQYRNTSSLIAFNQIELIGVQYISSAADLLYALERYRLLTVATLAGEASLNYELEQATVAVERQLEEISRLDQRWGGEERGQLGTTRVLRQIQDRWAQLRRTPFASAATADLALDELLSLLRDELILGAAASTSNLILDPDVNSYWLAETFAVKLPAIAGSTVSACTRSLLSGRSGRPVDPIAELAGLSHYALLNLRDVEAVNLKIAYRTETPQPQSENLHSSLDAPFRRLKAQLTGQLDWIKDYYLHPDVNRPPATRAAVEQTLLALNENDAFFDAIQPGLTRLIEERLAGYQRQQSFGLFFSGLAGAFLFYLFAGFYLSVRSSVHGLTAATERMIAGTAETFRLESRDELGRMADQYNQINTVLLQARALIEHSPDGIGVTQGGRLVYVNPRLVSFLGYPSSHDLLGSPVERFLDPARTASPSTAQGLIERRYLRGDGRAVEAEEASHPTVFQGAPAEMSIVRDVTERKRAEQIIAEQRVRNARAAGRAEIATAVLHNVGNVLNSVIVSANLCAETLRRSRAPGLGKAVALMRSQQDRLGAFLTEDAQGRQLAPYLSMLSEQLEKERGSMFVELERLQKNIAHVAAIVGAQQSFAKSAGASEPVVPAEIFDEALTLSSGSIDRSGIGIVTDYQPLPPLVLDRHKIIQILVNLLTNAVHAVKVQQPDEPKLTLRIWQPAAQRVRFAVSDNGVGISADHQVRIFSHGFTTKEEGHGFGLHASACFAAEMGGTLTCQSEGAGRGSSFILELPFEKAEVHNGHPLRA